MPVPGMTSLLAYLLVIWNSSPGETVSIYNLIYDRGRGEAEAEVMYTKYRGRGAAETEVRGVPSPGTPSPYHPCRLPVPY